MIHSGDPEAADKALNELVTSNLRLVVKIAHDFRRFNLPFNDIVSEGNVGLIKAAHKFEAGHGAKFSCYASWWIKQSIRKALIDKTRMIRIPTEMAKRQVTVEKMRSRWAAEHECLPTDEQVAEATGIPLCGIQALDKAATCSVSIDEKLTDASDTSFADTFAADDSDESAAKEEMSRALADVLRGMSALDRMMITWAYGLDGCIADIRWISQETGLTADEVTDRLTGLLRTMRSDLLSRERQD